MNAGTVTLGVFAIVFGLVAAFVVRRAFDIEPAPEAARPRGPQIVRANINLQENTRLRASDLQLVEWPAGRELPEGSIRAVNIAANRELKVAVKAGQIIRESDLRAIGESYDPAAEIPAGHVALTIEATGARVGGNLIRRGSKVDIALTVSGDHAEIGGLRTQSVLEQVQVLAVGNSSRGNESNQVTVAVTPDEANKLITAQRAGELSVTLVRALGPAGAPGSTTTKDGLLGLSKTLPEVHHPYTIEEYRNGTLHVRTLTDFHVREARDATAASRGEDGHNVNTFETSTPAEQPKQELPAPAAGDNKVSAAGAGSVSLVGFRREEPVQTISIWRGGVEQVIELGR